MIFLEQIVAPVLGVFKNDIQYKIIEYFKINECKVSPN